ncbi:uncharacterized protein G2W53_001129 [Senna tora]|uniref:Uncharacterized protein n=1 Tax=Senna tora TaxID=362788 RepID=A0A834XFB9_9FABA|nr:uncharacterized protein G2W53_001129 [Senna tora]
MCVAPFDLGVMNLTTTEKERGRVVKQMNCLGVGSAPTRRKEPVTSNGAVLVKTERRPWQNDGHGKMITTAERRPRQNDNHGRTTATVERPSRQQGYKNEEG